MKGIHMVTFILLVVGGLNWLLEVLGWGIGRFIPASIANIVYILVGLSAIYEIATHKKNCTQCGSGSMGNSSTGSSAM